MSNDIKKWETVFDHSDRPFSFGFRLIWNADSRQPTREELTEEELLTFRNPKIKEYPGRPIPVDAPLTELESRLKNFLENL